MIMKKLLILCVAAFCTVGAFAQDELDPKVFYKFGNFDQALILYLKDYKNNQSDKELNYRIGVCYLNTNSNKGEALSYLEFAAGEGYKAKDLYLLLGQAHMYNHNFSEAKSFFEKYKEKMRKDPAEVAVAEKHLAFCANAEKYMKDPINVRFINLGKYVNTEKSEFFPLVDFDEEFIVYNTNQRYVSSFNEYIMDIYWSNYRYGKWKRGKSVSSKINSTDYEYLGGASLDLNELFFQPDTYESTGDLFVSLRNKKRWDNPVMLGGTINEEKATETSATISPNGDTLYFASDRPGGHGGLDLYYALRVGGEWGVPQNMGEIINTPYNDAYPNINPDGSLSFASEGHSSMGGYDVFTTRFSGITSEWSTPKNLGYPLNTVFDDYNMAMSTNGRYGYVSQIRNNGFGEYDIYKVVFNDMDPTYLTYTGFIAVGDTSSYTLITEFDFEVSIKVFRKGEDEEPFGDYSYSKTSGNYVIALPPGVFDLAIEAEGYPTIKERLKIPEVKHKKPIIRKNIFLTPKAPPKEEKKKQQPTATNKQIRKVIKK